MFLLDKNISPGEPKPFKEFTLQWHITDRCLADCKHCYISKKEGAEISLDDFKLALGRFSYFLKKYDVRGRVYLTGGDPLLHRSFKGLVDMIKYSGLDFAVLGNYHNLNENSTDFLKSRNIRFFQLSLDGLEKMHDNIRHAGSFKNTIKKIELLSKSGISTVVNMTVTKDNVDEVVPLIRFLSRTSLARFDFTRVTPIGNSAKDKRSLLAPERLRSLMDDVIDVEKEIKKEGLKLSIGKRDHLWKLYYYEKGKLNIDLNDRAYSCGMGYRHLTILPNGDVLLCRKIERVIGNIFKEELTEIYKNSQDIQNIFLRKDKNECGKCKLNNICRGCPSIAYAIYKDLNIKDPQCWIK